MKMPLLAGFAALAISSIALVGCGGASGSNSVTVAPDGVPSGAIEVGQGDPFTVVLNVSPEQAKKGVATWARDEDIATPLAVPGVAGTTGTAKDGFTATFNFTGGQPGASQMGFRQVTMVESGMTPLRQTGTVDITVN